MRLIERRFVGGPMHGRTIHMSPGQYEYVLLTPASLEQELEASLKLILNGLVAIPRGQAVYRLNTTTHEFEYQEFG